MLTTFLYIQHLKKYRKTPNTYGRFEVSTGQTTKDFSITRKWKNWKDPLFSEEREI